MRRVGSSGVSACLAADLVHGSLEFGNLVPRADVPDVHAASQVSEASSEEQPALGLIGEEIPRLRAEGEDGLRLGVEHLYPSRHVWQSASVDL